MVSTYRIERDRGSKESRQQFAVLREKWPLAFPVKEQDVRPLAIGAAAEIGTAMGWSHPYTLGVLAGWKMAPVYCRAVLRYDQRMFLTAHPPNPSVLRRRTWQPSSWRNLRHARLRRKPRSPRRRPR
jgi:hypothetical protein